MIEVSTAARDLLVVLPRKGQLTSPRVGSTGDELIQAGLARWNKGAAQLEHTNPGMAAAREFGGHK